MEGLTQREAQVVAEIAAYARRTGRWPTMREVSLEVGRREDRPGLSLASTYKRLVAKGMLARAGRRQWGIAGYMVRVVKAELVSSTTGRAAR
jgi:hypothetical protein